jgi:hypothetical protein
MDKIKILDEVNALVAKGLRKTSIDLIEEYLEKVPDDPVMLKALGRIYLLEKKPHQAVKYLQLSLKNSSAKTSRSDTYELDELNGDDLGYIDEKAEIPENADEISLDENQDKNHYSDTHDRVRVIPTLKPPVVLVLNKNQTNNDIIQSNHIHNTPKNPEYPSDIIIPLINETKDTQIVSLELNPIESDRSPNFIINDTSDFPDLYDSVTATERWESDLFDEGLLEDQIVGDFLEDSEYEAGYFNDIQEINEAIPEKEFSWDDLDDFDEIDDQEYTNPFSFNEVEISGKLTRHERARQVAAKIIQDYDWDKEHLPLLEQVFVEYGWAQTRKSIERELNKGLIPEELELALFIRQLWSDSSVFWISFPITSKLYDQTTEYKTMSWPESLRIIRSFNGLPSQEEIQHFIESTYEDWYCNNNLRRHFKAFIWYLKYRTGSVRYTLPGNEGFSYINQYDEHDEFLDNNFHRINCSADVLNLKYESIDIESILQKIEQEYMVIKPEGDYIDDEVYLDNEAAWQQKQRNKNKNNPIIIDENFTE